MYFCVNLLFAAKTEVSLIMGRNESAGDIDQDDDRFLVALPETRPLVSVYWNYLELLKKFSGKP